MGVKTRSNAPGTPRFRDLKDAIMPVADTITVIITNNTTVDLEFKVIDNNDPEGSFSSWKELAKGATCPFVIIKGRDGGSVDWHARATGHKPGRGQARELKDKDPVYVSVDTA